VTGLPEWYKGIDNKMKCIGRKEGEFDFFEFFIPMFKKSIAKYNSSLLPILLYSSDF
jgi:hypothetical protein